MSGRSVKQAEKIHKTRGERTREDRNDRCCWDTGGSDESLTGLEADDTDRKWGGNQATRGRGQ
jgi:hypothetical protein